MFEKARKEEVFHISFVLVPSYSMISFTSAVEPFRLANRTSGEELYSWSLHCENGVPVKASNGLSLQETLRLDEVNPKSLVLLVGGLDIHRNVSSGVLNWLRKIDRMGANLGALCTGSFALAKAGLLDGHSATIHWENIAALSEEFPEVEITSDIYEIDGKRVTCAGGTAPLDLALHVISQQHGSELAASVADQFMIERIRDEFDNQKVSLPARLGVKHPKLLQVIQRMEANLEEPLSRSDLAEEANLSTRQLERLFRKYLNRSPARYYLELRLKRARLLLLQTNMSVIDVALACGFVSASHFSKCYRDCYHKTPRKERGLLS